MADDPEAPGARLQVVGKAVVGNILVVASSTPAGERKPQKLKIQWERVPIGGTQFDGVAIYGANAPRYLLTEEDVGNHMMVTVTPFLDAQGAIGETIISSMSEVVEPKPEIPPDFEGRPLRDLSGYSIGGASVSSLGGASEPPSPFREGGTPTPPPAVRAAPNDADAATALAPALQGEEDGPENPQSSGEGSEVGVEGGGGAPIVNRGPRSIRRRAGRVEVSSTVVATMGPPGHDHSAVVEPATSPKGEQSAETPKFRPSASIAPERLNHVPPEIISPPAAEEAWTKKQMRQSEGIARMMSEYQMALKNILKQRTLFANMNDALLDEVVASMVRREFQEGDTVVTEGEKADAFFVIETGDLESTRSTAEGVVGTKSVGDTIGELTLLDRSPRPSTIRAKCPCVLWELSRANFDVAVKAAATRDRSFQQLLRGVSFFSQLEDMQLNYVCQEFATVRYTHGSVVVEQGHQTKDMFVVREGQAIVMVDGVEVNVLGPGDHFGSLALLVGGARTATVVAKTRHTTMCVLYEEAARRVLRMLPGVARLFHRALIITALHKMPVLKSLQEAELDAFMDRFRANEFLKGSRLVQQGDVGHIFFVIRSGDVNILRQDEPGGDEKLLTVAGSYDTVGGRSLLSSEPHIASAEAATDVVALEMDDTDFKALAGIADHNLVVHILKQTGVFRHITAEQLDEVARLCKTEYVPKGEKVLRSGVVEDRMRVLKSGKMWLVEHPAPVMSHTASTPAHKRRSSGVNSGASSPQTGGDSPDGPLAGSLRSLYRGGQDGGDAGGSGRLRSRSVQDDSFTRKGGGGDSSPGSPSLRGETETSLFGRQSPGRGKGMGSRNSSRSSSHTRLTALSESTPEPPPPPLPKVLVTPGFVHGEESLATETAECRMDAEAATPVEMLTLSREQVLAFLPGTLATVQQTLERRKVNRIVAGFERNDLTIEGILGTGTYGRVQLVTHEPTGLKFALKVLNIDPENKEKHSARIRYEGKIMERLDHPFCLRMWRTFFDESDEFGRAYMLLELVDGGDLMDLADNRPGRRFSEKETMFYLASMVLAVEHMHRVGVVHRDIKLENILLDSFGYAKLADFGLAVRVRPGDRRYTMCGTVDYMAPEIINYSGHGPAVDIWSLGVLMYEMICGQAPFYRSMRDADGSASRQKLLTYKAIASLDYAIPDFVSKEAADLIRRILVLDPRQRLGAGRGGFAEIRAHPWFRAIDFAQLMARKADAPLRPKMRASLDMERPKSILTPYKKRDDDIDEAAPPRGSHGTSEAGGGGSPRGATSPADSGSWPTTPANSTSSLRLDQDRTPKSSSGSGIIKQLSGLLRRTSGAGRVPS